MTGPFADARDATAQHLYQVLVGFLRVGIGPVRGDAVALVHLDEGWSALSNSRCSRSMPLRSSFRSIMLVTAEQGLPSAIAFRTSGSPPRSFSAIFRYLLTWG